MAQVVVALSNDSNRVPCNSREEGTCGPTN